ncbi:MAG TPA: PAS domain S-box protein [Synergistetes bacterium]|nr:PAS domain S-box protein [Synergistota bacterium]
MALSKRKTEPFKGGLEDHLRLLVESSPEGMVICDANDRIVFANPEFCRMFGWERSEVTGMAINEIVASSPDILEEASMVSSSVLSNPHVIPDTYRTHRNGSKIPVSLLAGPIYDGDKAVGVYGIYRDTSPRKQAEAKAGREKAFFENLFENSPDAIVLCDRQEKGIRCNRAFTELFGFTSQGVSENYLNDLVARDPELHREARNIDVLAWSGKDPVTINTWRTRSDGTMIPVRVLQFPFSADEETLVDYTIYQDRSAEIKAEAALKREKHFFEALFELSPDAIIIGSKEGRVIRANNAFYSLFGYELEDRIIGKHLLEMVTKKPESTEEAKELDRRFWAGEKIDRDVIRQRKDGTDINLHLTQVLLETDDGDLVDYIIYRDIDRRKKAEAALRESQQQFLHIVEDQDEFIIRFSPDGILTFANSAYCRRFGKTREELVGRSIFDHVDGKEAERLSKEHFNTITPENPSNVDESWSILPDGEVRLEQWQNRGIFDEEGRLLCIQSVGRDITSQREAERALRESEKRYAAIVEGQVEMVCRFLPGGEITFVNDAFCSFFGTTREEAIVRPLSLLVGTKCSEKLVSCGENLAGDGNTIFVEHPFTLPSGEKRWIRWSRKAIFDDAGSLKEIQTVGRDFTDIKEKEEELRHLNAILRSIRGVNRIIYRHNNSDKLVRDICAHLIETLGYRNVWIGILGACRKLATITEAGLGSDGRPLSETTRNIMLSNWGLSVLEQSGVISQRRVFTMTDCPLMERYEESGIMASRLEYEGRIFGLISVSIPGDQQLDPEEKILFSELVSDVSFALHTIELTKENEEKTETLEGKARQLELLVDFHRDGLWEWNVQAGKVVLNSSYETSLGYAPGEMERSFSATKGRIHPDDLPAAMKELEKAISGKTSGDTYRTVYRMRRKDGSWQRILDRGYVVRRDRHGRALLMVGTHTNLPDTGKDENR